MNPIAVRAVRTSLRPTAVLGLVGAALVVLTASWGLAPDRDTMTRHRVTRVYAGLCRAELIAVLAVVTTTAAAAIASERQARTWDALALSTLSNSQLVLGKAAGVLRPAMLLASFLVPVHLAYGMASGTPWSVILSVHGVVLGGAMGAAGLGLLFSAVCGRVLHAVALAAAAIMFGWFAALDGLAGGWAAARLARAGNPLRLLDDLLVSAVPDEVARVHVLAFLLAVGLGSALALLAAIRLARRPVEGTVLAMRSLFWARPGKTKHVWDDPVYWRECRSRGARRTLRIGGVLLLVLVVVLFVANRDPAAGGLWAQFAGLSSNYMNLLIQAGTLMLCLRASVLIVEERRRGMLAPLALAGISPARLVGSKLRGVARPAVPLIAMIMILWVWCAAQVSDRFVGFIDSRLWLDGVLALSALVGGYFLAISIGLLASSFAPSLRVALLAGPALLYTWVNAGAVVQQVLLFVWPGTGDPLGWLWGVMGHDPRLQLNVLIFHVLRFEHVPTANGVVSWVAVATLAGLIAFFAAVFRVSREYGEPVGKSVPTRPKLTEPVNLPGATTSRRPTRRLPVKDLCL
jgi:hypothetical protein